MISLNILLATLGCAVNLVHASWSFADDTCHQSKKDTLTLEIGFAFDMANFAAASFSTDDDPGGRRQYYNDFIAVDDRTKKVPADVMYHIYNNIARMLNTKSPNTDYAFTIACDDPTNGCTKLGFLAHMNDKNKHMNFCNKFFDEGEVGQRAIVATTKAAGACLEKPGTLDLRGAQRTRSAIIVHECTHTNYVMGGLGATKDYAYGFNANWLLPRELFNRACAQYARTNILCPELSVSRFPDKEGLCLATKAVNNADTYSFIAAGVYFSVWCGKIPYPELPSVPPTSKARARRSHNPRSVLQRDPGCPPDDSIWFDGPDDDN